MTESRSGRSAGRIRAARLTDLAALGELSRLAQAEGGDGRSLGVPVSGPRIGVFSLFRLPLGAFQPHDLLFVHEQEGRLAGLVRVERENQRDDWTIVELDAVGVANAGDIRLRLVQQVLREGAKRGAARFHVACADADDNVELFMQAGFVRYGEEIVLYRPPDQPLPEPWSDERAVAARIRPARPLDALGLLRLHGAVTPTPVQRLEALRLQDWERQGAHSRVPPSSLAPILRFADVESWVQDSTDGASIEALVQLGIACEDQPHYLRVLGRPGIDLGALIEFGLGVVGARVARGGVRPRDHGVIAPVRTYEHPTDRRLEDAGFATISTLTLLLKETLVRVAEPALVPAGVRSLEVTRGS